MRWIIAAAVAAPLSAALAGALLGAQSTARASTRAAAPTPATARAPACKDADGDGYGIGCRAGNDCNDSDASIHPGSAESCNFRDDDCNGRVDDAAACSVPALDATAVKVPAGRFLMGSESGAKDEKPVHEVVVGAIRLDRYEVTNRRYSACEKSGACSPPSLLSSHVRKSYYRNPEFADYPVVFVSWQQANTFCQHAGGRLPTEAEWEHAAKGDAPSTRVYPWGNEAPDCSKANLGGPGSCIGDTDRVGRRPLGASPFGAMDMAGNVWEWTADWYGASYYEKSPGRNPRGPEHGSLKVMRGGCWLSGADSLRVSCRKAELPATWAYNVGFRCAYPGEG